MLASNNISDFLSQAYQYKTKYCKRKMQLMPIIIYISNNILVNSQLSVEQKILKINESFSLYKKLLTK